jgi:serine/threonine-protein kinase SRPK3
VNPFCIKTKGSDRTLQ